MLPAGIVIGVPTGMRTASQSRVVTTVSCGGSIILWKPARSRSAARPHKVCQPQGRAFDAGRVRAHAGQRGQFPVELQVDRLVRVQQILELLEQTLRLVHGFPFDHVCHQRRGRHRDRAAAAVEARRADLVVIQLEVQGQLVAAQGVVSFQHPVRLRQRAEVPRIAVVINDQLLVKIVQVIHHWNIFLHACMDNINASTSAKVL